MVPFTAEKAFDEEKHVKAVLREAVFGFGSLQLGCEDLGDDASGDGLDVYGILD